MYLSFLRVGGVAFAAAAAVADSPLDFARNYLCLVRRKIFIYLHAQRSEHKMCERCNGRDLFSQHIESHCCKFVRALEAIFKLKQCASALAFSLWCVCVAWRRNVYFWLLSFGNTMTGGTSTMKYKLAIYVFKSN
jgi:hypothetical protein